MRVRVLSGNFKVRVLSVSDGVVSTEKTGRGRKNQKENAKPKP